MLASLKVSTDIRAQLQSHGLGGIQYRHYDRHSYALEKKQALEKWARHLTKIKAGEGMAFCQRRGTVPGMRDGQVDCCGQAPPRFQAAFLSGFDPGGSESKGELRLAVSTG
ncbi:MAG: hypothetical protein ACREUT_13775 [Steroidobacteraceae bacterium]